MLHKGANTLAQVLVVATSWVLGRSLSSFNSSQNHASYNFWNILPLSYRLELVTREDWDPPSTLKSLHNLNSPNTTQKSNGKSLLGLKIKFQLWANVSSKPSYIALIYNVTSKNSHSRIKNANIEEIHGQTKATLKRSRGNLKSYSSMSSIWCCWWNHSNSHSVAAAFPQKTIHSRGISSILGSPM